MEADVRHPLEPQRGVRNLDTVVDLVEIGSIIKAGCQATGDHGKVIGDVAVHGGEDTLLDLGDR